VIYILLDFILFSLCLWTDFWLLILSPSSATLILSASHHPTINYSYQAMTSIEKQLKQDNKLIEKLPQLGDMINPMKEKFDKYWGPMKELAAMGLLLDPRYKMRYLRYSLTKQQLIPEAEADNFMTKVRSSFLSLWTHYVPSPPTPSVSNPAPEPLKSKSMLSDDISGFHQYMAGSMESSLTNAPAAELDLYLEERNLILTDNEEFNILKWWGSNAARFPSLSEVARILLMIPMTSVASESAFSTGGRVLDDYRMRLSDDTVEALLCTQDWINAQAARIVNGFGPGC
jgi:hypothetical protein